jgi:hypothetical protein
MIGALLVLAAPAQVALATPPLVADYQFQGNLFSSVPGAPNLTDLGVGNGFASENTGPYATTVLTFPQGNGLMLNGASLLSDVFDYSFVIDMRLANVGGTPHYRRIYTINSMTDAGLYAHDGKLDWYTGSANDEGPFGPLADNTYAEVALTGADDAHSQATYVNGVQQAVVNTVSTASHPSFFQDNTSGASTGEESSGAVSRIRVYDGTLSPSDVSAIFGSGLRPPSCPVPSGQTASKSHHHKKCKKHHGHRHHGHQRRSCHKHKHHHHHGGH